MQKGPNMRFLPFVPELGKISLRKWQDGLQDEVFSRFQKREPYGRNIRGYLGDFFIILFFKRPLEIFFPRWALGLDGLGDFLTKRSQGTAHSLDKILIVRPCHGLCDV